MAKILRPEKKKTKIMTENIGHGFRTITKKPTFDKLPKYLKPQKTV